MVSASLGGYSSSDDRKQVAGSEGKEPGQCVLIICMYCSDRKEEEKILVL